MARSSSFHEDVFYEYFQPFRHPSSVSDIWGSHGLETFGADLELVRNYDLHFVWTVLDGHADQWIVPGLYRVNRVCYLLTEVSHRGVAIEFRISRSASSLSQLGLTRRIATLRRILHTQGQPPERVLSG